MLAGGLSRLRLRELQIRDVLAGRLEGYWNGSRESVANFGGVLEC